MKSTPIDKYAYIPFTVKSANYRNHILRQSLSLLPIAKIIVGAGSCHCGYLRLLLLGKGDNIRVQLSVQPRQTCKPRRGFMYRSVAEDSPMCISSQLSGLTKSPLMCHNTRHRQQRSLSSAVEPILSIFITLLQEPACQATTNSAKCPNLIFFHP